MRSSDGACACFCCGGGDDAEGKVVFTVSAGAVGGEPWWVVCDVDGPSRRIDDAAGEVGYPMLMH